MSDLADLDEMLGKILDEFPEERRKLVERSGDKLYKEVLRNIDKRVDKKTGKLREACEKHIGSGGGYAAVRNNHRKAPHAHLVEDGHSKRKGAERKRNKHGGMSNIKGTGKNMGWVDGKFMYRDAINRLADELAKDSKDTMDKVLKEVGLL